MQEHCYEQAPGGSRALTGSAAAGTEQLPPSPSGTFCDSTTSAAYAGTIREVPSPLGTTGLSPPTLDTNIDTTTRTVRGGILQLTVNYINCQEI